MERAKGKYYTYSVDLLMEKGLNKISVGVVDDVSNVSGFAREQIIAQDLEVGPWPRLAEAGAALEIRCCDP